MPERDSWWLKRSDILHSLPFFPIQVGNRCLKRRKNSLNTTWNTGKEEAQRSSAPAKLAQKIDANVTLLEGDTGAGLFFFTGEPSHHLEERG